MSSNVSEPDGQVERSDQRLLDVIGEKDERAFDEFYSRSAPAVARFAWSASGSREAVDELLQETFLLVWRKPAQVRLVNESALPWLLITCRNFARNYIRRQRKTTQMMAKEQFTDDSAVLELRWVLDSMVSLPQTDRSVCELVLLHGLTYREAAEHLLISEASVGKRLHRSRQRLRKEME